MGIRFVLLVNKQGQTRLAQYYEYLTLEERGALEGEIVRKMLPQNGQQATWNYYVRALSQRCKNVCLIILSEIILSDWIALAYYIWAICFGLWMAHDSSYRVTTKMLLKGLLFGTLNITGSGDGDIRPRTKAQKWIYTIHMLFQLAMIEKYKHLLRNLLKRFMLACLECCLGRQRYTKLIEKSKNYYQNKRGVAIVCMFIPFILFYGIFMLISIISEKYMATNSTSWLAITLPVFGTTAKIGEDGANYQTIIGVILMVCYFPMLIIYSSYIFQEIEQYCIGIREKVAAAAIQARQGGGWG